MKPPFFSVVIPTYNQASFLKNAIRSVINQNFKNYEIIIIDNNSKDDTKKTVEEFVAEVTEEKFPEKKHLVEIEDQEFNSFLEEIK